MSTAKSSIYGKLSKVLNEIGKVPKSGWNDFHKYKYVTEADLTEHVRPLLAKHGLSLVFGTKSVIDIEGNRTRVECVIHLGYTDGNEIVETIWGEGQDKGEKGIYKAMTGAMKYWLYKTFLVSTGDDPEATNGQPQTNKENLDYKSTMPAGRTAPLAPEIELPGDGPRCPTCESFMRLKPAGTTQKGTPYPEFYGCSKWPDCRGSVNKEDYEKDQQKLKDAGVDAEEIPF